MAIENIDIWPKIAWKLENLYMDYQNNMWGRNTSEKMFRDDNPETVKIAPFSQVYKEMSDQSKLSKEDDKWILDTKYGENNYRASAKIIGKYDPKRLNVIFHPYAGTEQGELLAKYLLGKICTLKNNFNLIAITAHGHEKQPNNPKRNVMSEAFPTMESVQGTIATSAKLIEEISKDLEKSSVPVGVSMGGVVVEWNRLLSDDTKIAGRITIGAHHDEAKGILSEPFEQLIDNPTTRRNLDSYKNAFSLEGVPEEAFSRNENSTVILGQADNIIKIQDAREYYQRLGIKPLELPFGHYTLMTEGIPSIPWQISRSLKDILSTN